ncbi:MAG TPA: hypothetical protein VJK71_05075 [Gemmatimonadales bacterium]|nr:hypothetical protein [Gemmatimonadales bacterium]
MGTVVGALSWLAFGLQFVLGKAALVAQDIQVDINPDRSGSGPAWYGLWWVWVLIAVFIIVIVALTTRGSGKRSA